MPLLTTVKTPFATLLPAAVVLAVSVLFSAPSAALSCSAEEGVCRFGAMDTAQNGVVSREEFFAANPQMKDAAFDAIDADQDGILTHDEWDVFTAGHSKGNPHMGAPHGGAGEGAKSRMIMPSKS